MDIHALDRILELKDYEMVGGGFFHWESLHLVTRSSKHLKYTKFTFLL